MRIKKRTFTACGMAVVLAAFLFGVLGMPNTVKPAAAQVDWCAKLQQSEDVFNRGEIDLFLEDYADDIVFKTSPLCDPVECVGKDAYRNNWESYIDLNSRWTTTSCEVSGDTVTTKWEWADDTTRAAGIDRIIGETTCKVQDDKIVAQRDLSMDLFRADPQTAQWLDYCMTAVPSPLFQMGPGRDANQSPGFALIPQFPDFAIVYVRIQPGPAGVPQPIHIHEGTCGNLGPVAFALGDVDGAVSYTVLRGVSPGDLQTGNFAIAVQKSHDEPDVFVACGDIPALPAEEAPPAEGEPTVLVTGSPIHGANGILFDADDQLYIASAVGREILVMDAETGEILDRLGPDQGVESPDDVTFGTDGSLYWTALVVGEVGRLAPDGTKTSQSVALGVNAITFSDDGRLFVALDFWGDALYELDPNLVDPPRLIAEDLGFLNGMDWGPDGFLYGPIWTKGEVVRIDVDAGAITTVADGFGIPAAVKFDSQGRLHVADYMRGEISRVDTETGDKEVIATGPPGLDNIAFDSQDRLFVTNARDGSILEVLADGTTRTLSPGGMIGPVGVAVLPRADGESVFVADIWTLREFDGATGEPRSLERHYMGIPGGITSPQTVSADGGHLVLSSWFSSAVQVWDLDTREVVQHLDFAFPLNAIRFEGDLIIADLARVVRVSAADPTAQEVLAEGLDVPTGLAATDDDLWVSERDTGSVLQLVADGEPLSEPLAVATGLSSPEGLAVAPDASLLVVEAGAGRLSRIDVTTGEVSTVAEGLALGAEGPPTMPSVWGFNGVAVGPSGAIYVTGDVGNVLYRIEALEPMPVIAPVAELPPAGSGGLRGQEEARVPTWWYGLGAGGAFLIAVSLAALSSARRRR